MRKIFTLFLLLIPLWMQAQGYTWDEETKTLTIKTDIPYDNTYEATAETLIIESTYTTIIANAFKQYSALKKVIINDGVTSIGNYAFSGCTSLKEITIPNSVTSIGGYAFGGCTSLKAITIPDGVTSIGGYTFSGCTSLESVTIGDGVTSIGSSAFNGCTFLKAITIPDGVTSIGSRTFEGCTSLKEITIPNSVTSIGSYAFQGCSELTEITIPGSVTSIKEATFQNCTSLESVTIGNGVTSIGIYAFNNCTSLTNIVYEGTTKPTSIGDYAFSSISTEATVTVPADYEGDSFGDFSGEKLKKELYAISITSPTNGTLTATVDGKPAKYAKKDVTITLTATPDEWYRFEEFTVTDAQGTPVTVTGNTFTMPLGGVTVSATFKPTFWDEETKTLTVTLGETTEYSSYKDQAKHLVIKAGTNSTAIGDRTFSAWPALQTVTIKKGVKTIGDSAFRDNVALTSVSIEDGLESIKNNAFWGCSKLEKITIPNTVTSIGGWAFRYCSSLQSINIPKGITTVNESTFHGCFSLTEIIIPDGVTSIMKRAFDNCTNLEKVIIPKSITTIEDEAFCKCNNFKELIYQGVTAPASIAISAFNVGNPGSLNPNLIVTVPGNYQGNSFGPLGYDRIKGKTFTITINKTADGTVTAKVGDTDNATSAGSLEEVTLNVQPEEGYQLTSLMVNGGSVTVTEDNTFIMPFGDATVAATFKKTPQVSDFTFTKTDWMYGDENIDLSSLIKSADDVTGMGNLTISCWQGETQVSTPTNAGDYTVKVSVAEGESYAAATDLTHADWTFTIQKATPPYETPTNLIASYGETLEDVALPEGWAWESNATQLVTIGDNLFTAIFTPEDTNNYTIVRTNVTVTVSKAIIDDQVHAEGETVLSIDLENGNTTLTAIIESDIDLSGGKWTWTSSDESVATVTPNETSPTTRAVFVSQSIATITAVGVGTTTITATYETDNYKGSVSYTLTVTQSEGPDTPVTPDYPDYYNIYVDECEGVTVLTSTNVVREGNSMTFTIEVAEGYTAEDMVVKVKRSLFGYTDVIEPNEEGKYEVRNIYTEIYITIEGVTEEETPTGIEELPQAKVYAKEGSLYVETPQCETVTIVSMTGAIVGQSEQIGLKRYDLPRGIYIIGIGTERYKVRI